MRVRAMEERGNYAGLIAMLAEDSGRPGWRRSGGVRRGSTAGDGGAAGLPGLFSRAQATNSSTVDLLDPSVWRTVAGGRVHVDDAAMEARGEVSREETACVWGTGRRARVSGCGATFCRSTGARRMAGTWPSRPRAAARRPPPLCEQRRKERGRWAGPHCS